MTIRRTVDCGAASSVLPAQFASADPAVSAEFSTRSGLRMPAGVVHPFDLHYLHDDVHVIAYFEGHPIYEAVEAMIRHRNGQSPSIRAILTRHDQSQIDHTNDEVVLAQMRRSGLAREVVHVPVKMANDTVNGANQVTVTFVSTTNETIELCVQAASPADSARGGLTDPGEHAATTSLPIMVRDRSSMAGQGTTVKIDGVLYSVLVRVNQPPYFVGLHGFYTEGHRMGLIRAGTRALEILEEPTEIRVNSRWLYRSRYGEHIAYRAIEQTGAIQFTIALESSERYERVKAEADRNCLYIDEIEHGIGDGKRSSMTIRFAPTNRFSLCVGSPRVLSRGTTSASSGADAETIIHLDPTTPDWAKQRRVRVTVARSGQQIIFTSLIGRT